MELQTKLVNVEEGLILIVWIIVACSIALVKNVCCWICSILVRPRSYWCSVMRIFISLLVCFRYGRTGWHAVLLYTVGYEGYLCKTNLVILAVLLYYVYVYIMHYLVEYLKIQCTHV